MTMYCKCDIPSPSSHHTHCLNENCKLRIESIYEECSRLREENRKLKKKVKQLEKQVGVDAS